jgi:hypothetical protein
VHHVRSLRRPLLALASAALLAGALTVTPSSESAATAAPAARQAAALAAIPVSNFASRNNGYGVVGSDVSTSPVAIKANVLALAEWNGRIYVGGSFTQIARWKQVQASQPFLAAFDRATGTWIDSFRPALNGVVWDLVVTPEGRLVAGGYFDQVNGSSRPGMVALDPATGQISPGWNATGANTTRAGVRTLDVFGGWIYVGGNLTSVTGGSGTTTTVTGKNMFRVRASTGQPDPAFAPRTSTAPWDVYASRRGDRVYAAGQFGLVNNTPLDIAAVFNSSNGALVPGLEQPVPSYDCRPNCRPGYSPFSLSILETQDGAHVVTTATEHTLQLRNRTTMAREYGHITLQGGDYQALAQSGDVIYAACHCFDTNYSGAYFMAPGFQTPTSWDSASPINMVGAYDATTFQHLTTFVPDARGSLGDGVWELLVDSTGCLWMGGDLTKTVGHRWLGGIAKYCA